MRRGAALLLEAPRIDRDEQQATALLVGKLTYS